MTEHKCNSCFYMQHERDKHPCNVCDNYNKYVNRNVYINSNIPAERKFEECLSPDFKPLTQAVKTWDFDDAFDEQKFTVTDNINSPKHYMLFAKEGIEVRHVLEKLAEKINEASNIPDSPLFVSDYVQMMQYFMRFMEKNGKEDLEKGQWFLNKILSSYERYHT